MDGLFHDIYIGADGLYTGLDDAVSADVRNFSLRRWENWYRPQEEEGRRRLSRDLAISRPAVAVITKVAERQSHDLSLDQYQRLEELERELEAQGMQVESRHIEALNLLRERLIDAEIGERISRQLAEENRVRMLLLLAVLA